MFSVRKLSNESEEKKSSFLRKPVGNEEINERKRDGTIPMRVVSQQHKIHRLFDNLAAEENLSVDKSSSNENAIDQLNLLEEEEKDDESEWNEPPQTVFDPERIGEAEESKEGFKKIHLIEQNESESDDDSSCTSGESDDSDDKTSPLRGKDLRLLSSSKTKKLAEMLKDQKDFSQMAYKERDLSSLFEDDDSPVNKPLKKRLLDTESDED